MADDKKDTSKGDVEVGQRFAVADDVAAIPKGTIDPVYEAKARVLNRAVRPSVQCGICG